jgi:outer membrane protein assembly factor BamB
VRRKSVSKIGHGVLLTLISVIITGALGAVAVWWWQTNSLAPTIARRIAIKHNISMRQTAVDIVGQFVHFADIQITTTVGNEWPQFRGSDHTNISQDTTPLLDAWPESGPPELWRMELGEGYSGAAIKYGRVYLLDYLENEKADCLRCFSLEDGQELWRRWYRVKVAWSHGYSRTVPAVAANTVVTIGPKCQVLCADALDGAYLWGIDMVAAYGTEVPLWYTGQCPLIDGNRVILAPAGTNVLLTALDLRSGHPLWSVPNPGKWKMSHSCVVPMTIADTPMYVYFALGGALGVSTNGAILWQTDAWTPNIIAPSPVHLGNGLIFMTSGHGAGSIMLQIVKKNDVFTVLPPLQKWSCREFSSEQQTPIWYNNSLYTILPKDGGPLRQRLRCMDIDGTIRWSSEGAARFGLGPYLIADNKMFILEDSGRLTMAQINDNFKELASYRPLSGKEAWAPMAIADGRLIMRDWKTMVCLDLRKKLHE